MLSIILLNLFLSNAQFIATPTAFDGATFAVPTSIAEVYSFDTNSPTSTSKVTTFFPISDSSSGSIISEMTQSSENYSSEQSIPTGKSEATITDIVANTISASQSISDYTQDSRVSYHSDSIIYATSTTVLNTYYETVYCNDFTTYTSFPGETGTSAHISQVTVSIPAKLPTAELSSLQGSSIASSTRPTITSKPVESTTLSGLKTNKVTQFSCLNSTTTILKLVTSPNVVHTVTAVLTVTSFA